MPAPHFALMRRKQQRPERLPRPDPVPGQGMPGVFAVGPEFPIAVVIEDILPVLKEKYSLNQRLPFPLLGGKEWEG